MAVFVGPGRGKQRSGEWEGAEHPRLPTVSSFSVSLCLRVETYMVFPQQYSLDGDDWQLYYLLPNEWRWRKVWQAEPPEAAARRIRAMVPGVVQQDLLDAGVLPHPYEGLNSRLWEWTSQRDW